MNKKLSFVSVKAQEDLGVPVTVTPALDYVQFSEFEIEHTQYMDNVRILTGKFTSEPEVPGNAYVTCKGKIPLVSAGSDVTPQCDLILKAAGFTLSERVDEELGTQYIYTRSGDTVDLSICKYDFKDTQARVRSINSVMFTGLKIILESGKVPMLEFTGQGLLNTPYESIDTVSKPTQSKIRYYSVNDFTSAVLDTSWELVKADVEIINKITHKPLMTGYGYGAPEITDQESKFNFTVLADTEHSQPLDKVGDDGEISFVFGSQGRRIRIQGTRGQILSTKDSATGDLISHDVSGKYIDNSLVITFNYDLLPEFEYQDTDAPTCLAFPYGVSVNYYGPPVSLPASPRPFPYAKGHDICVENKLIIEGYLETAFYDRLFISWDYYSPSGKGMIIVAKSVKKSAYDDCNFLYIQNTSVESSSIRTPIIFTNNINPKPVLQDGDGDTNIYQEI